MYGWLLETKATVGTALVWLTTHGWLLGGTPLQGRENRQAWGTGRTVLPHAGMKPPPPCPASAPGVHPHLDGSTSMLA